MQVGLLQLFQNFRNQVSDMAAYGEEVRLAELAEPLGFDGLWSVEHHFKEYSMCPNNLQFLTFMAGRTSKIKLGSAAVILPWHNPLRVIEEVITLDHLSGGRALLGVGRGLAQVEYDGFQVNIAESRERFEEALTLITDAVEKGYAEFDGTFYKQPRTEIRPAPFKSFRDRLYTVAMSPDSVAAAAKHSAVMMMFAQIPWADKVADINNYRRLFHQHHGCTPPPVISVDFMFCHADPGRAEEMARQYISAVYLTTLNHYEMSGDSLKGIDEYDFFADIHDTLADSGLEAAADQFVDLQAWGTPQQILDKLEARGKIIGDFDLTTCCSYGGMPYGDAESSMRLFAAEVIPELQKWAPAAEAAE